MFPCLPNKFFKVLYTKSSKKFKGCVEIDLSHNTIQYNDGDVFPSGLQKLSSAHNKISYLHPASLSTAPDLSYLDSSDNMLSTIPNGLFSSLQVSKILKLSFNRFSNLQDLTVTLRQLNHLIINGNTYATMTFGMIQALFKLIKF